jgi:hypothetical protein
VESKLIDALRGLERLSLPRSMFGQVSVADGRGAR